MKSLLGQFCDRALEAGWLLGVIITPVFFNVYSSRVFEPDKLTTLRALAVVMAVLWITRWLEGLFRKEPVFRFSWRTPMVLPALVTMVIYLISSAFSLVPFTSMIGSYQRLQGTFTLFGYLVIFLAIITSLRTRAQLSRLVTVLILNSLPVSLYGIIQHSGLDPLPWAGDVTSRVASNMGNAIFVAAYLIMIVPLTGARIVESFSDILNRAQTRLSDILRASGYIFLVAVQLLTIWYSGSRGPWLGTVAAAFLFPYLGLILLQQRALAEPDAEGRLGMDLLKGVAFGAGVTGVAGVLAWLLLTVLGGKMGMYLGGGLAALVFGGAWLYCVVERKGWRWLWIAWGVVGLAVAAGLVLINVPGPLQDRVRAVPSLQRLTTITELEGGTGKVRTLIWQGTVELIKPHAPLKFPDGTVDRWNFLRPLVGYGPESMYVAYNSFYPPELGHYESRTASPDRSHNETLDSLTITGVLGFGAYLFTFVSVFYWGFRWLGLLKSMRQMWLYLGLIGLFFVIFFVIAWRLAGAYLFAVAVPLGVLVGTMIYLTLAAFGMAVRRSGESFNGQGAPSPHALLLVGIMTAVIAHFVEINFGIAIASTRTTFWALAGLLVVLGSQWVPGLTRPNEPVAAENSAADRQPVRRRREPKRSTAGGSYSWVPAVLALSLVSAFLLGTLAFDFINNPEQLIDAGQIFQRSLTMKYYPEPTRSYGALMIFMFTWLLFGVVGLSEYDREGLFDSERMRTLLVAFGVYAGVALFGLLIFGSSVAGHQAYLKTQSATSIEMVVDIAEKLASLVLRYYGLIFVLLTLTGAALLLEDRKPISTVAHPFSSGILVLLLIASIFIIGNTCYDLIRADVIYKQGGVFANENTSQQKQIGIEHFKRALEHTPREDYYYLFLGKAYLELTQGMPMSFSALSETDQETLLAQARAQINWDALTPEQQELQIQQWRAAWEQQQKQQQAELFLETERVLWKARELNPLNTDHSANLARFYKSWAARVASDMTAANLSETEKAKLNDQYQDLLQQSLENYETALLLSPNNPIIWNEKAQLYAIDMGDMVNFYETITQSLKVDEGFEQTWMLLGDMRSSTGDIDGAIDAYQRSLKIRNNCTVRRVIGTLQAQKPDWAASIKTLSESLEVCATAGDLWDFHRIIAIGQANLGDTEAALQSAQQALALAPESQRSYVEQLIASLQPQIVEPTAPVTP
ncbi:MAG TPA: O-antigen ligase family protein [Anaerolineae bacterium]|nr:O-antigen ligase family protein [Anaerolineae bacterium]